MMSVTDKESEKFYQSKRKTWAAFTRFVTWSIVAIVVLLVFMAIVLI